MAIFALVLFNVFGGIERADGRHARCPRGIGSSLGLDRWRVDIGVVLVGEGGLVGVGCNADDSKLDGNVDADNGVLSVIVASFAFVRIGVDVGIVDFSASFADASGAFIS